MRSRSLASVLASTMMLIGVGWAADARLEPAAAVAAVAPNPDGAYTAQLSASPDYEAGRSGWAMVLSGHPNQSYWNGDGENIAKVGPCPQSLDSSCNGIGIARSYFSFDASALAGKDIVSAEFNAYGTWSPSCEQRWVEAWTTSPVSSGTTWNNQPYNTDGGKLKLGAHKTAFRSTCPETADRPHWIGFNARNAVTKGLSQHGGKVTILLKAADTSEMSWKKFAPTPKLIITYNSAPSVPLTLSVDGKACGRTPNEPYLNPQSGGTPRGPSLKAAKASDPDGGQVRVEFAWATYGSEILWRATTAAKASGSGFSVDVPPEYAPDGAKRAYKARTYDGRLWSGWTVWCHVVIDRIAPAAEPTVTSELYPECVDQYDCPRGGGIGRTGTFLISRDAADDDVTGFYYDLHDQPQKFIAADASGNASIMITPPDEGTRHLYVRSVDRAGNVGPIRTYRFVVGAGTEPVGH